MKLGFLVVLLVMSPFAGRALKSETPVAMELAELKDKHQKAITTATEPLLRRYIGALEQLQRKATQANALNTALQIKQAIDAATAGQSPMSLTAARVAGSGNQFERELAVLKDQHQKAVTAATAAIYRRSADSLEQLQRKATQSNDLPTALLVRQELAALESAQLPFPVEELLGTWRIRNLTSGYTASRVFEADGQFGGTEPGEWTLTGGKLRLRNDGGDWDTFTLPPKEDGKIYGRNSKSERVLLERLSAPASR